MVSLKLTCGIHLTQDHMIGEHKLAEVAIRGGLGSPPPPT